MRQMCFFMAFSRSSGASATWSLVCRECIVYVLECAITSTRITGEAALSSSSTFRTPFGSENTHALFLNYACIHSPHANAHANAYSLVFIQVNMCGVSCWYARPCPPCLACLAACLWVCRRFHDLPLKAWAVSAVHCCNLKLFVQFMLGTRRISLTSSTSSCLPASVSSVWAHCHFNYPCESFSKNKAQLTASLKRTQAFRFERDKLTAPIRT